MYWLKLNLATIASQPRNLCLLVLNNTTLVNGWSDTLNSDQNAVFWLKGHGLKYLDLTNPKTLLPQPDVSGVFKDIDVVIVPSSWFRKDGSCWPLQFVWHTVIADEVHGFLRGNHNARDKAAPSNTLKNWYQLLDRTKSTFVITGTPFYTNISWDFKQITRATGTNMVRQKWGEYASDEGLDKLFENWSETIKDETRDPIAFKNQQDSFNKIAQSFAIYTIRRDKKSRIDGEPVIVDYLGKCERHEEPLEPDPAEQQRQQELYRTTWMNRTDANRNHIMRNLTWCDRYTYWAEKHGARKEWWADFTLHEAQRCIRTKDLIKKLVEGTQDKRGMVVFCQTHFQIQLCMKVFPFSPFDPGSWIDLRTSEAANWFHWGCESKNLVFLLDYGGPARGDSGMWRTVWAL